MPKNPKKHAAEETKRKLVQLQDDDETRMAASAHTSRREHESVDEIVKALTVMAEHGKVVGLKNNRVGIEPGPEFSAHFEALFTTANIMERDKHSGFAISRGTPAGIKDPKARGAKFNPNITRISCEVGAFVGLCKRFGVKGQAVDKWTALLAESAAGENTVKQ